MIQVLHKHLTEAKGTHLGKCQGVLQAADGASGAADGSSTILGLEAHPDERYHRYQVSYLSGSAARIGRNQEDLHNTIFLQGQWESQIAKWVKSHRNLSTFWTNQSRFEEAVECIHNHRVIPQPMILPGFLCNHLEEKGQDK